VYNVASSRVRSSQKGHDSLTEKAVLFLRHINVQNRSLYAS